MSSFTGVPALVLFVLLLGSSPSPSHSRTWTVNPGGTGDAPTIQAGIDSAAVGDTVRVECGSYYEQGLTLKSGILVTSQTDDLCVNTIALTPGDMLTCAGVDSTTTVRGIGFVYWGPSGLGGGLRSESSSPLFDRCRFVGSASAGGAIRLDSGSDARFVSCEIRDSGSDTGGGVYSLDSSPEFVGCSFLNNSATTGGAVHLVGTGAPRFDGCSFYSSWATDGGAVYVAGPGVPWFEDCAFQNSHASANGGAAYCSAGTESTFLRCSFYEGVASLGGGLFSAGASPTVVGCQFHDNDASRGAAVYCDTGGTPSLSGCVVYDNHATSRGGGFYFRNTSPPVDHCTFAYNRADQFYGAGLCLEGSSPLITNTIIAFSVGSWGISCYDFSIPSSPSLMCCNVYGNDLGDWTGCIGGQNGTYGNFSTDPVFCSAYLDDYRLRSCSPCEDAAGCGLVGALGIGCGSVLSVPSSYATIQSALDAACVGDTVSVSPGTYYERGIQMRSGVILRSYYHDPTSVTIDGQRLGRIMYCVDNDHYLTMIEGITFTGGLTGSSWPADGGAAVAISNSRPRIVNCRFVDNESGCDAGAILSINGSEPTFTGCEFENNRAFNSCGALYLVDSPGAAIRDCSFTNNACSPATGYGGAMMTWTSIVTIEDTRFVGNTALHGGAIRVSTGPTADFSRCLFRGNMAASQGGAIFVDNIVATVSECTLYDNYADLAGSGILCAEASPVIDRTIIASGRHAAAIGCTGSSFPALTCSDLWANEGGDWVGCVAGQLDVAGNVSADPLFCDVAGPDLTLWVDSPCVTATCGLMGAFPVGCPRIWHVPADAPTIQAGIDSAGVRDTVEVACGTYHEHDLLMKSGVTLRSSTGEADCVTVNADSLGRVVSCFNVDSTATVRGLTITGGWTNYGGGLIVVNGSPSIERCVFTGNTANLQGGGICVDTGSPAISDATIVANRCPSEGGGIYIHAGTPPIERTVIASSPQGAAVYCTWSGAPNLACTDIWGNAGGDWVGAIAAQAGIVGNFSADPLFCDPAAGDWSLAASSPCLPGNHPDGTSCGVVGALGEGCAGPVSVPIELSPPTRIALYAARPNPFVGTTVLRYDLPAAAPVTVRIHDVSGRVVTRLLREVVPAGRHAVTWDGRDDSGHRVASGVYFARLEAGDRIEATKIVRLGR